MRERKYTFELLSPIVKHCKSYAELLVGLGLKQSGGNHRLITMRVKEYGIDTSHFLGQKWAKGYTKDTNENIKKQSLKIRTPHEKVFCENSGFSSSKLYKRLVELGWEKRCAVCKITDWMNMPMRFHVDHKNGNHSDNRIENLRFLCPNCHQQTETWGAKKQKIESIVIFS